MASVFPAEDGWKSAGIRADMLAEVGTPVIVDHCSTVMRAREVKNEPRSRALSNSSAAEGAMSWHAWTETDGPASRPGPLSGPDPASASTVSYYGWSPESVSWAVILRWSCARLRAVTAIRYALRDVYSVLGEYRQLFRFATFLTFRYLRFQRG